MSKDLLYPILALVAAMLIFSLWPGLDLIVSGWFHDPDRGFWLAGWPVLETLRQGFWNAGLAAVVVLAALTALTARLQRWLTIPARVWGRALLALLLGPGLLVNGLLKSHWGRARPRDITAFGGAADFTPPLTISHECARNCSFVSGEGALAVTLALVLWGLFFAGARPALRRAGGWSLAALAVLACALRVLVGGHFLSDTLFAAGFCALVVGLLNHAPGLTAPPPAGPQQIRDDLRRMVRRLACTFRTRR